jgi:putative hydrolase of the HAD superfamily
VSRLSAIAFDWGGVFTVGTFDGRAIERLAEVYGVPSSTLRPLYLELMEEFEVGAFDLPTFAAQLSRTVGRDVDEARFRTAFLDAPLERPEMYTLLAGIPSAWVVGMLSNNVPVLCDRVRSDPRSARIEKFVFSNEIGVRKPDPAAFAALAEALALPPERSVFIDDNADNVAAARGLGFAAIALSAPAAFAAAWRTLLPELADLVAGAAWSEAG